MPRTLWERVNYWRKQCLADAISWHKGNNPKLTVERIGDYSAGFDAGWRDAVNTLKMHNLINEKGEK